MLTTALIAVGGYAFVAWLTEPPPVQVPADVVASATSESSASVTWKAAEGAQRYRVEVSTTADLSQAVEHEVAAPATQVTVEDLPTSRTGQPLYARVTALRDVERATSDVVDFSLKPAPARRLKVAAVSDVGFKLTWRAGVNSRQWDVTSASDKAFTRDVTTVRTTEPDPSFVRTGLQPNSTQWVKIRPVNGSQHGDFTPAVKVTTAKRTVGFRVGAWNVCSEKCPNYEGRGRAMAQFVDAHKIDILALQEAGGKRVGKVTARLFTGHSQGFQIASGGARAKYIVYRPALFEQLDGGSFGIGDGRDTTWAKFKLKRTGQRFVVVSVHLENGHGNDAKRARETDVMLANMARINADKWPIVYAGDFNSGVHRAADSPGAKMRAAGMENTFTQVPDPVNGHINTSHTFASTVPASGAHVDHIWVSPQFSVRRWHQLVKLSGAGYAQPVLSDHNLIATDVSMPLKHKRLGKATATVAWGAEPSPDSADDTLGNP